MNIPLPTLMALAIIAAVLLAARHLDKQMQRRRRVLLRLLRERNKDLSVAQVRAWAQVNNVWLGSPGELIGELTRMGYVVLTPDNWRLVQAQLDKHRQPTVTEWLEREEGERGER